MMGGTIDVEDCPILSIDGLTELKQRARFTRVVIVVGVLVAALCHNN